MTGARGFSIVLVTYNSAAVIGSALEGIPAEHDVIVVDNASSDNSTEIARSHGARIIALDKNFGFGTACNRGAEVARSDFLLFLNPDAVPDPGALELMFQAFEIYPEMAAANPRLIEGDGRQFFRRRNQLLDRAGNARIDLPNADCEVKILSGAALAIRKAAFETVGGFDEDIFLYYEDDDLSARLVKAGYSLRYLHGAIVRHTSGHSSPPSPEMLFFREFHAMKAKEHVMRKHGRFFNRPLRLVQEWFRARFSEPGSWAQVRAKARLKALQER